MGFSKSKSDTSLFIYKQGQNIVYLLLYVDDIVLTASTSALLRRTIDALQLEFSMKDLGPLHHFLGISVHQHQDGLFLSQRQYILDIVERAVMSEGKPCSTPVDTHAKVPADIGPPVSDPTHYKSLAGALHYLTFTRPDISYASSRSVYICMIRESPTCLLSSESYSIFVALSIMVFFFIVAPLQS